MVRKSYSQRCWGTASEVYSCNGKYLHISVSYIKSKKWLFFLYLHSKSWVAMGALFGGSDSVHDVQYNASFHRELAPCQVPGSPLGGKQEGCICALWLGECDQTWNVPNWGTLFSSQRGRCPALFSISGLWSKPFIIMKTLEVSSLFQKFILLDIDLSPLKMLEADLGGKTIKKYFCKNKRK